MLDPQVLPPSADSAYRTLMQAEVAPDALLHGARVALRVIPARADPPVGCGNPREELVPARSRRGQGRRRPGGTAIGREHVLDLALPRGLLDLERHDQSSV